MKESTKQLLKASGIRAARTFIQALLPVAGTMTAVNGAVDWNTIGLTLLSAAGTALISFLSGLVGLPEVNGKEGK